MKQLLILLLSAFFTSSLFAQHQDFENWPDEHEYLKSSWEQDGFAPRWVNGFDQSRAFVDDAVSRSGSKSLRVLFPAEGVGPNTSGVQAPLAVPPREEYYVSYWLRFSENFSWGGTSEGGKLPGLAGGANCSGCTTCDGTNGFSARLMWRPGGQAVLYLYHMDKTNTCGDNHDLKDEDGNILYFQKGQWYNIKQRVKVNSGNNNDGEVELWVNNQRALLVTGIKFVTNGDQVDNLYFSTFHGGSGEQWAPGVDCHIWFDDIEISESVITGKISSPSVNISVSPNPFNEAIRVQSEGQVISLNIYSTTGEQLESHAAVSNSAEVGKDLKAGLYIIKVTVKEETRFFRIVKGTDH